MPEPTFLSALQAITAGRSNIGDVIGAANAMVAAGEPKLAQELYKVWIGFNPNDPRVFVGHFNLASLQTQSGDDAAAKDNLTQAIAIKPDFYPAYINLGGVLERAGQADQAILKWQEIVTRLELITAPSIDHKLTAIKQIARVLLDNQKSASAEVWLRAGLGVRADQRDMLEQFVALRMGQCEWPVLDPWDGTDRRTLMVGVSPLSMAAYTDDPLLQLATAHRYVAATTKALTMSPEIDRRRAPINLDGRRVRVGYVSSDYRDHAIGYLMPEVFELHDKLKVETFVYYTGPAPSGAIYQRYRDACDHWLDINGMDDEAAARRIAADGIDILVDVNGLTRFARTDLFALRPAPIQVNWLGFPGPMATPYHHYIIADDWIIPPESELYYSETVLRLPCYQSNDRRRQVVAERPTRADVGLPEDAFVFCCFNGSQKFTRFTVDRWVEILNRTPGGVLWLLDASSETNERLTTYAQARGVERGRIIFAPKQVNAYHLARYPLADLFLDTSPYGAHTTASDALWMGVPVLTLSGRGFAARVCGSLVRAAGLPDLICETAQDYVERAVALAHDPTQIAALKARLEAGRASCDLFNMDKLVSQLEALYAQMCANHQNGLTPRPDLRNLEHYLEVGTGIDHEALELRGLADYQQFYRDRLRERHLARPMPPDSRLWTEAEIEAADAPPLSTAAAAPLVEPEAEPARLARKGARA